MHFQREFMTRARMLRIMKTAAGRLATGTAKARSRLARLLIQQLIELVPKLRK